MNTRMTELNLKDLEKVTGGGTSNPVGRGTKGIVNIIKRIMSWFD